MDDQEKIAALLHKLEIDNDLTDEQRAEIRDEIGALGLSLQFDAEGDKPLINSGMPEA